MAFFVISTHIMQEVEAICDRVIIINRGKIVADEKTAVIQQKTRPDNILEVEFDTSVEVSLLETVKGISKAVGLGANKYRIHAPSGVDPRGDLFEFAVRNKIKVLELQKSESSLEEVFQTLTGGKK